MPLRFFADHCVSRSVVEGLEADGHEVLRLRNHLPTDASDRRVIIHAQEQESILLYRPEVTGQILGRLKEYLAEHPDAAHYAGKLLLVEAHRIRIRQ